MAALTPTRAKLTGTSASYVAAGASGDTFDPGDNTILLVKNGSGSSITVTVATPGNTEYGQAEPDVTVTVAAGAEQAIGPFPASLADPTDGKVHVTYSSVTTVTILLLGV